MIRLVLPDGTVQLMKLELVALIPARQALIEAGNKELESLTDEQYEQRALAALEKLNG